MNIDFNKATAKDFVNIPGYDANQRAKIFSNYLAHLDDRGLLNYRLQSTSGCGPIMDLTTQAGMTFLRSFLLAVSTSQLEHT